MNKAEAIKRFKSMDKSKQVLIAEIAAARHIVSAANEDNSERAEIRKMMLDDFQMTEQEMYAFLGIDWALEGCPGFDLSKCDITKREPRK